jgi:hypothetical protein
MIFHPHIEPFSTRFVSIQCCGKGPVRFRATAHFGFGRSLYFHRKVGPGIYEAELWVTVLIVPVFPLAIWIIRPRGLRRVKTEWTNWTIFESDFIGKRFLTLIRLLLTLGRAFFHIAIVLGPLAASYSIAVLEGRRPSMPTVVLFLSSFVWGAFLLFRWDSRRDYIYNSVRIQLEEGEDSLPGDSDGR